MVASVAWIAIAPVKALALVRREEVELEPTGVRDDRAFYLVGDDGRMVNGKVASELVRVVPDYDAESERLRLILPGGAVLAGQVDLGAGVTTDFFGRPVTGRLVDGPWSEALSEVAGRPVQLVRADRPGTGVDRGPGAGVSLVATASLDALAAAAGVEQVDSRRFRMLFGVEGIAAHAEDEWIGRRVQIGEAVVLPRGNVGRCAVTTQNPDSGVADLDTLRVLEEYRGDVETTEPRPFGVWGMVVVPGRVRIGDTVVSG
jgi:uncharacterized protein YcbX